MSKTIRLAYKMWRRGDERGLFSDKEVVRVYGEPVFVVIPESNESNAQLLIFDVVDEGKKD
jgi:hypothetical protein